MACKIEVDQPIFISSGEWPNEKMRGYVLREIESRPKSQFIGLKTASGKVVASDIDHVFGKYILDTNTFSSDKLPNEHLEKYTYQEGYLEKPILD